MNKTYLLVSAALFSTSLMAQMTSPSAPAMSGATPAATASTNVSTASRSNSPAARRGTRRAGATQANTAGGRTTSTNAVPAAVPVHKLVALVPGPAVIVGSNVNVRGQANLAGEVIVRLNQGDPITVLESIAVERPKKGEPEQWARIAFPTNAHVWVFSSFIDRTNKTVSVAKLNMRGGPGENYSVVGTLKRGEAIREITARESWTQIEPPTNAYAFVAAEYVKQEPSTAPVIPTQPTVVTTPTPPPTPITPQINAPPTAPITMPLQTNAVAETPPVTPAVETINPVPTPTNTVAQTPAISETPNSTTPPTAAPATGIQPLPPLAVPNENPPAISPPPLELEALPKRVVQREGIVRNTWSIQAPSSVELANPDTGATMDYLYSPSAQVNLKRYRGLRVLITGEEGLDKRWKNTPVLVVQKIQIVE